MVIDSAYKCINTHFYKYNIDSTHLFILLLYMFSNTILCLIYKHVQTRFH